MSASHADQRADDVTSSAQTSDPATQTDASQKSDVETARSKAETLKVEWEERRKKIYHDKTPSPDVFKDKLYAIVIGLEHCTSVAHEVAYVLETCCGYHHSHVFRLIGDACTYVSTPLDILWWRARCFDWANTMLHRTNVL